ncbi:MAG: type I methionyl aminopeptidase [Verrucomicrobia bacterium]|nr:type I methionyl aminopeptidase [Verrucomicrobiota bacterium]NBU11048.1 type I methionyl aminopeptidase [Pseudomonadota bacterium]NDA65606.1 type I methionyl aminopeptidase [Verrucomicrobiota bacterium]NDB75084.1 type I methionyl aminopeptidase [Verrucomicrobiota bacterium]NDD38133.1 type I methionyl aminopeptidase [Verrucomicrobiota bacterium]
MSVIKTERELVIMRAAGAIAASVLNDVCAYVRPGLTTRELDEFAAARIRHYGATSAFLGYRKYPCNICISVNDEVVHGLSGSRRVQFGDLISLDVGVRYQGYIGDTAKTIAVGGCGLQAQKLIDVTTQALYEGISRALAGNRVVDISRAVQKHVEANGFSVVREFVGHGVGRTVHEEPQVPNFVESGKNSAKLRPGMTIAIEPMVNAGSAAVKVLSDGWTVVTQDGMPSAHMEHTVLITDAEPEILTCPENLPSSLRAR